MLQDVTYNPLDSLSPIRVDDNPELFPHVAGYTYHLNRDSSITQVWTATKIQTAAVPSRIEVMTPVEKYVDMGVVIFLIIFFLVATERIVEGLARAVWAAFIPKRHEDIDNEMALRSSRNIAAFFLLPTALFAVSRTPEKFLFILAVCVIYFAVKYGIMAIMDYVNRTSVFKFTGRMGLDYVDIFYHHRPDPETPIEETIGALGQIVASGKALYAGISNYNREQTEAALRAAADIHLPLIVNQRRYSIFDRGIEEDGVKRFCREQGMGIIAFSPLAQGLLTDRYLHGIPEDSRIARDHRFLRADALTPAMLSRIAALNKLAEERGQTLAEMALAWILRDGNVCSVIIGASRPEQIEENVRFLSNTAFTEEELQRIDAICKDGGQAG